jgi:hypothetical protein
MLFGNRFRGTRLKQGAAMMVMLLTAVAPQASHACVYMQAPEAVGLTSGEYFAKTMSGAATYVDLVLVEDDGTRPMGQPETGIITVRTIARFKGNSADRFTLFGTGLTLKPGFSTASGAPLQHFTSETGQVTPFPFIEERQGALLPSVTGAAPVPPPPGTSCSPPSLAAKTGRFYLVMRGADGRLLGLLQRYGRGLGYEVAQVFTTSVRREQARTGTSSLVALEIDGDPATFANESFYAGSAPLEPKPSGLAQIEGADEAAQFDTQQRIERDIWLLGGGGGNQQGILPR